MAKILIVDDSEATHALLRVHLQADRLETASAHTGEAALRMIADQPPELVLLDIDLPDIDGFEVCRRIRENPFTMNLPVIFITASIGTAEKVRGLDLGASDYITKPFQGPELRARVRALMRVNSRLDFLGRKRVQDILTEPRIARGLSSGLAA